MPCYDNPKHPQIFLIVFFGEKVKISHSWKARSSTYNLYWISKPITDQFESALIY